MSSSSSTVVPLTAGSTTPIGRKITSFNGLLPRTFSSGGSSGGKSKRLSFKQASHDPTLEFTIPSSSSTPLAPKSALSKEESKLLMERILLILRHLRARVTAERLTQKLVGSFIRRNTPASQFSIEAKQIAYTDFLSSTLAAQPIETLVGVVKLCFQSQDAPLLDMEVCKELECQVYDKVGSEDEVNVQQLSTTLNKLPTRSFDILTQLVAVLNADDSTGAQAYSWGPTLFLPRFDSQQSEVTKMYESAVDVMKWSQMSVSLTQLLVQNFVRVFPQQDEKVDRLVKEMVGDEQVEQPVDLCRVMFAFEAEQSHELSAGEGEVLTVLERGTDGWWSCQNCNGQVGLVPATYVEPVQGLQPEAVSVLAEDLTSLSLLNADSEIIDEQIAEMQLHLQRLQQIKEAKMQLNNNDTFCSDYLPSSVMGPPPPPPTTVEQPPPAPCERPKSMLRESSFTRTSAVNKPPVPTDRPKSVTFEKTPAPVAAPAPAPVDEEAEKRADAYKIKGNEKLGNGEYVWAVECYTQALEISPRGPNSHLFFSNRAAAHMHMQDYEAAIGDCKRAVQLKPDFAKAYSRLAQAQLSLGRVDQARQSCEQALQLDPTSEIVKSTLCKIDQLVEVEETVEV